MPLDRRFCSRVFLCDLVQRAVERTGMVSVPVEHKVKLLSDDGSGFVSRPFNEYPFNVRNRHVYTSMSHPQTCGKMEQLNLTANELSTRYRKNLSKER